MKHVCLCLLFLFAGQAVAQTDVASETRLASERLSAASAQLDAAQGADDRVNALTRTIEAYEVGIKATEASLRRAVVREEFLTTALDARQNDIARLLGVLQTIGSTQSPVVFLHPSGPTGTARAGMMVADIVPGLQAQTEGLKTTLAEIAILRQLQQDAIAQLKTGQAGAKKARDALQTAIENRTELPRRFTEDPIRTAILISSTETLDAFASGLSDLTEEEISFPTVSLTGVKGELPLPVVATVLRQFNETDAAGIVRPGLVLATPADALVTAPVSATIRYRGPLLDYGNVMILEPTAGTLFVIAGMDIVYGEIGEIVKAGHPLGLMGASSDTNLTDDQDGTSGQSAQTLYIEVREGQSPVDPLTWFALEKD